MEKEIKKHLKSLTYAEQLEFCADVFNVLRDDEFKIIRNPSKIQQATATQVIISPVSGEFIARPTKR